MTLKNRFFNAIILLSVGLTLWSFLLLNKQHVPTTHRSAAEPDAFMENVDALILDKTGLPKMKIYTPKMVHYVNDDTTHLIAPQIILYRQSPIPWYIHSKFAKASQGADNIEFWNNVLIRHPADVDHPETTITTNTLTVHTNRKTAETRDAITLSQPSFNVQSIGMFADMNTDSVNLLSNVRGEYVPNS